MRKTMFGDTVIESTSDDLGLVEELQDAGDDIYAVVRADEEGTGKFDFEVLRNDDGGVVVTSDPIFGSTYEARDYLKGFVVDIQFD